MLSLETWIGLRYMRAKKRNGLMSVISIISIFGIATGVTALIVVLSVMNGFQKEIRGQLLQVTPSRSRRHLARPSQNRSSQSARAGCSTLCERAGAAG